MAPWDIRSDDTRVEDSLPTFIIFCEDTVSEVDYFGSFQTEKIKINTIRGQKQGVGNVLRAINHCEKNDLFDEDTITDKRLYVWCVYDRDIQAGNGSLNDTDFDESIKMAESKGINVAWSNDCFEIWILLHFDAPDESFIKNHDHRDKCYDRLTEIFSNIINSNPNLIGTNDSGNLSYKGGLKSNRLFSKVVKPAIKPHTNMAIERAKSLYAMHDDEAKPHLKIPCTKIYELVELLLSEGS
jgi:hypothetical protein